MPISTDLSVSPYFDDFDPTKDYNKILFRPGVAVQARELNQLQSILQKQIERFGDNIFKKGTIIDGCHITYKSAYPYVKLQDNQTDGAPVNVNQLVGYYVQDTANLSPLIATVENVADGYEAQTPDLKTLFVRYVNSGYANVGGVETLRPVFQANDNLTVFDPRKPIESITINDGSAGFVNTDSIAIVSAIAIQNSTNGTTFANNFYVDDHINDGTANVKIVAVDTTSNTQAVILRIEPRAIDLKAANSQLWTLSVNTNIQSTNTNPSDVAKIVSIVGSGATAVHRTNSLNGAVDTITITNKGSGYYVLPTVSVVSTGATTVQINNASLEARTELTTVSIANSSFDPVGSGYAITIGEGVVYQKGYFSRVARQTAVVNKYSNTGFTKAAGFDTTEEIFTSTQDPSLLDNATGEPNFTAPGANRLKMTPTILVKDKADADEDTNFFSIVEFNNGVPYKQNPRTVYNIIDDEISLRTYEESGNYVVDPFLLTTRNTPSFTDEQTKFNILIDPGKGYIKGKRVETVQYYEAPVNKGTDTFVANNLNVSLDYGSYVRVNEVGGSFNFKAGDIVDLYPTAGDYITTGPAAGTVGPPSSAGLGTTLGTARIRSMVLESGVPGTPEAVYRLYLFDIKLATARNFTLIRSIFYNGGSVYKGIADTVLEGGVAVLYDSGYDKLLYYAGAPAVKNGNNFAYIYRTIDTSNTYNISLGGLVTLQASGSETFPYTAGSTLSPSQEADIVITPLNNSRGPNLTGTATASGVTLTGSGTSFTTDFEAGDYITLDPASSPDIRQIVSVNSDTEITLSASSTKSGVAFAMYFPTEVPISLRGSRTANVDADANTLIVDLQTTVNVATDVAVAFNRRSNDSPPVAKTVNRDQYVRLDLTTHAAGATGPWPLGVGDVFRLNGVYKGANNTYAPNGTGVVDITEEYYIDHNQNENYYGMSYLYRRNNANTALDTVDDRLLIEFDYFTHGAEGLKAAGANTGTYPVNDALVLASSPTTINTLEIPEVYGTKGNYYDLRDHFDFRPLVANTVAPVTLTAEPFTTPVNPAEPSDVNLLSTNDKLFPAPSSELTGVIEHYRGRRDLVVVDSNTNFQVIKGTPGSSEAPAVPVDTLPIQELVIPPYPTLPKKPSPEIIDFMNTRIANEIYPYRRTSLYSVTQPYDPNKIARLQPRGYTMVDIGKLEKRIAALEYYTQFTLLEALTEKRSIPSSANAALERFKFGFFVDNFDNYNYAETANPNYAAQIIDGVLTCKISETVVPGEPSSPPTVDAFDYAFISQPNATDPGANGEASFTTQTVSIIQNNRTTNRADNGSVWEEFFYTFSASSGIAELYLNARDNNMAIAVYQSSTPGSFIQAPIATSATAAAITTTDIYSKNLLSLNGGRKIEHPGSLNRKGYGPVGGFIEDQFKMSWSHDPDNGVYYKVRVYKGRNHGSQGRKGTFGYKLFYPADVLVNQSSNTFVNGSWYTTPNYYGSIASGLPVSMPVSISIPTDLGSYLTDLASTWTPPIDLAQKFDLNVTGLKPSTEHIVFLGDTDFTTSVKQSGQLLGETIKTDENGNIDLSIFYGPQIEPNSSLAISAANVEMISGVKSLTIKSADDTSSVTTVITPPEYVKANTSDSEPISGGGASPVEELGVNIQLF